MRKALFAMVLVAASFAGGAAVNGPGLRWVRDMVLNQPGVEITTTTPAGDDLAGDSRSEPGAGAGAGASVAPVAEIPSRPVPPLVLPPEPTPPASPSPPVASQGNSGPQAPWAPAPTPAPPPPAVPETTEVSGGKSPEASTPLASLAAAAVEPPAPLPMPPERNTEPTPAPAPAPAPASVPIPLRPIAAAAPFDRDINRAVLPNSPPSAPASTPPPAETPAELPTAPAAGLDDWGAIRRKLRALGVARYEIEGEPEGRVRFSCVIPLAGRRAVSQHFEGEGSNELEAAQTALRRVALWRATEPSASASASASASPAPPLSSPAVSSSVPVPAP